MWSSVVGYISQHYVQSTDHRLTTEMTKTTAECLLVQWFNVSVVTGRTTAVVVTYKHLRRLVGSEERNLEMGLTIHFLSLTTKKWYRDIEMLRYL